MGFCTVGGHKVILVAHSKKENLFRKVVSENLKIRIDNCLNNFIIFTEKMSDDSDMTIPQGVPPRAPSSFMSAGVPPPPKGKARFF